MTKLFWPVTIGTVISAIGVLGASRFVMSTMPNLLYGAAVFYIVGTGVLFWRVNRSGSLAALSGLAVVMTVVTVVETQVLDLLWSGGLSIAKDFTPFSWAHLAHTIWSLEIVGIWYGLVALAAYSARWLARSAYLRRLFWFAVIGAAVSAVSELGYMWLAASATPDAKYVAVAVYVVVTLGLFWYASRSYGLATLFGLAAVIAFVSVAKTPAFDFMRGATDITWNYLSPTILFTLPVVGAWYSLVVVATHAGRMAARGGRPQQA